MEASDYRRIARERLTGNWLLAAAVAFVAAFLGGPLNSGGNFNLELDAELIKYLPESIVSSLNLIASIAGIMGLVCFIIGGTVQLGYVRFLLKQHDRQNPEFMDLFSQFHRFGEGFLQAFLRALFVFLWSLLFIIPGIVKGYSYAMTPFIMNDHPEMTAKDAIDASPKLMNGHKAELFYLDLTFIGWSILCIFTFGIGFFFLTPYIDASHAAFYRNISNTAHNNMLDV